jgi:predicted ATPase/signal transduction histidine kinase
MQGYRVEEALYEGAKATLFRAVRTCDGRPITLKVLNPGHCRPEDRERLRRELDIGRSLAGADVVEPLALSSADGLPALELEPFAGRSLDRLAGEPMPFELFLQLALRLAHAVASLHDRGVIHKDLKPGNILYAPDRGELRIIDFELASRAEREQTAARSPRLIEGSLPYISPEQTGRMNRALDSRSDLYSLGVTLYELLTGRLPFSADDALGWVHCHLAHEPAPPETLRPEIPPILSQIVLKLLAKIPDDRYQSAAGLAHDLARCLEQLQETGRIAPFPLGAHDLSDRFLIPQKLFGRDSELATILSAFAGVAESGRPELVLVSGYSGIGKSAVVQELQRPIAAQRGLFIVGKCSQYQREVPYRTIVEAVRELALELLTRNELALARWRRRIIEALGSNGQLIVDLIPQLGLLIGPQPPPTALPPIEAEVRLRLLFRQMFSALATREHPLVLFLDDLQWADPASLKLLVELVSDGDPRHLLLIGAYRDNEVDPAHPLVHAIDDACVRGARVRRVVLGPLSAEEVQQMVAATARCAPEEAAPLARLVFQKSGGNPFFVIQLLTVLHKEGLIAFDRRARRWRWDVERISAHGYTDNVVELMAGKLRAMPAPTQEALRIAAALGSSSRGAILALVLGRDPEPLLSPAIEDGLISRADTAFRFSHDRVEEAAYSLTPEPVREALHLRIGRLLLRDTPPESLDAHIFELCGHLDRGAALMTSAQEREHVAELNLRAGLLAKASAAYGSALPYLKSGRALLPESCWESCYELTFALEINRAECEYLDAHVELADSLIDLIVEKAHSPLDKAKALSVRISLCQLAGSAHDFTALFDAAQLLGVTFPRSPDEIRRAAEEEIRQVRINQGDRPAIELLDLPPASDPGCLMLVAMFTQSLAHAHSSVQAYYPLLAAKAVNLSLRHGNSIHACHAYMGHAFTLGALFDDLKGSHEFAELGLALNEKLGIRPLHGLVLFVYGSFVNPWHHPYASSLPVLERSFAECVEAGDPAHAVFAAAWCSSLMVEAGAPLDEVFQRTLEFAEFAERSRNVAIHAFIRLQQHVTARLRGSEREDPELEARFLEIWRRAGIRTNSTFFIRKLEAAVVFGQYEEALDCAAQAAETMFPFEAAAATLWYYHSLAMAALHGELPPPEQAEQKRQIERALQHLESWARHCPENFADRAALVSAELARLEGRDGDAMKRYEQAIRAARENGFVHHEALAYETASRFYRSRGLGLVADTYLREARSRYLRWGAEGKVRQLDAQHPPLLVRQSQPSATPTMALRPEQIDLVAVLKASQTLSSVMVRDQLLHTLLEIVLEQGGARRARLFLSAAGGRELAAAIERSSNPAQGQTALPLTVLDYVERTHERVILDDAALNPGRFAADPYLRSARPRSVLCQPILRQARPIALLYLDNDLLPGAFTPERLTALDLLAAQAAISLENAQLLEREHGARLEAESARRRALLLSDASALLSSTLDFGVLFDALARLCVRTFADWVVVDLLEGERSIRLAGAHRDPRKEPLLKELAERYPARPGAPSPAGDVLDGRAPRHRASIPEEAIASMCVDAHHAELVRALGAGSFVAVPLIAREELLGALTLAAASPDRFEPADFELAVELGRRLALALDNARLLQQTQRALQMREEFIAVASHELRTPLTSLQLSVQSVLKAAASHSPVAQPLLKQNLERIGRQTGRMAQLVGELFEVTRLDHGPIGLQPRDLDLAALVRQVVERFDSELSAARCSASLACEGPIYGCWDPSQMDQVISNLLANAIKFGAGQPIEVRLGALQGTVRLEVQDHGIGIDPLWLPRVFERFERAVPASHYGGLGLGLYIARAIVRAHGGTIRAESRPGEGSTFIVELPSRLPAQAESREIAHED